MHPIATSGYSPASSSCSSASIPITVWCMSTWLSTDPRLYFLAPPLVAAASTASEMAIPSDPGELGSCSRIARPACVLSDGLGVTEAPKVCIRLRRYGFCS